MSKKEGNFVQDCPTLSYFFVTPALGQNANDPNFMRRELE